MNESQISEWHTLSKFELTDGIALKRLESLNSILENDQTAYWVDVVRIYLELKPDEKNVTSFVSSFQSNDEDFPRLKIEKLTKALAAMALTALIKRGNSQFEIKTYVEGRDSKIALAHVVSEAILNAIFLNQIKIDTRIPLLQSAKDFLSKYTTDVRDVNFNEHQDALNEIEDRITNDEDGYTSEESLQIILATKKVIDFSNIQKEELNILWWIFGEYSDIAQDYFKNIDSPAMAIIAARELFDLTSFTSRIPSAQHLLRKILSLSKIQKGNTNKFNLATCMQSLSLDQKKKIISVNHKKIDELTPCLNALVKTDEKSSEKRIKLNLNEELQLNEIAFQFYKELVFLSAL